MPLIKLAYNRILYPHHISPKKKWMNVTIVFS